MEPPDDATLLARIASGEQEALKLLYARYRPRLWSYLLSQFGRDAERTEEVLQDIFVAIWRHAATFRGTAQVATWIFRIAHNQARNAQVSAARHPMHADIADENDGAICAASSPVLLETQVIERLTLRAALAQLSAKHRLVLDLICSQGFTVEETAEILGVPAGTVKSRLSYARRALAVALAAEAGKEVGYGA